jgi:hypothetical protein
MGMGRLEPKRKLEPSADWVGGKPTSPLVVPGATLAPERKDENGGKAAVPPTLGGGVPIIMGG